MLKSYQEFHGIKEDSNKTYQVKDKSGKVVFTGKYNQVLSYRKKNGGEIVTEFAAATQAGQRGPGLGNFKPMVSMKKEEGTALHKYLVSKGVHKK